MDQPKSVMPNPVIDEVQTTRARLVQEHGGLRGWAAHLQERQRKRSKTPPHGPESPEG